jgi:hypothetical protein
VRGIAFYQNQPTAEEEDMASTTQPKTSCGCKRGRQEASSSSSGVKKMKTGAERFKASVELETKDMENLVAAFDTPGRTRASNKTLMVVDLLFKKNMAQVLAEKKKVAEREVALKRCMLDTPETILFVRAVERVEYMTEGLDDDPRLRGKMRDSELNKYLSARAPDWKIKAIDLEVVNCYFGDNSIRKWQIAHDLLREAFERDMKRLPYPEWSTRMEHYWHHRDSGSLYHFQMTTEQCRKVMKIFGHTTDDMYKSMVQMKTAMVGALTLKLD